MLISTLAMVISWSNNLKTYRHIAARMSRRVAIRKMPALAARAVGGLLARKVMGGEDDEEDSGVMGKVKGAAKSGAAYAQAQQASQQRMEERGQQMADKAKAGSQIATGEAMDMSWQMLKAWSFVPGFDAFDKELVINHAKKRKLKHVSNNDLGHHDVRFNQRYKPDQEMPKGAENSVHETWLLLTWI